MPKPSVEYGAESQMSLVPLYLGQQAPSTPKELLRAKNWAPSRLLISISFLPSLIPGHLSLKET